VPQFLGGGDTFDNAVAVCARCGACGTSSAGSRDDCSESREYAQGTKTLWLGNRRNRLYGHHPPAG
jgi:hypothetical protein